MLGGMSFPVYRLLVVLIGFLVAFGLWLFQEKTLLGAIVRAGVDDKEMVSGFGINIRVINTAVFAFGSLLADLPGDWKSDPFVYPRISWEILILSFDGRGGRRDGELTGCLHRESYHWIDR